MEQGEKRAIHPFFRKGLSFLTLIGSFLGWLILYILDFGTSAQSASQPAVTNGVPSHDLVQNGGPIAGRHDGGDENEHPGQNPGPSRVITLPVALLEPDPNSSRRKRRRTDQHEPPGIANGTSDISGEGGHGPAESVIVNDVNEPHMSTPEKAHATPESPPKAEDPVPEAARNTSDTATTGGSSERRYPERQRTLRLNPNGKLLSSPVGKQPEEKGQKGSKKGAQKGRKDGQKLVVIKYTNDENTRQRLGKLIDDIANGQTRFCPQPSGRRPQRPEPVSTVSAPITIPAPRTAENQSPRPTHPFFMKKATHKADASCPPEPPTQDLTITNPSARDTHGPPSLHREGSSMSSGSTRPTSFRPRSKFPEPIRPLWPPRDFVHVRGAYTESIPYRDSSRSLEVDQKKAKGAAVRVHDGENVLLSGSYGRSLNKDIPQALRIPGKHAASGQTVRKAIMSQLSEYSTQRADATSNKMIHPVTAQLESLLATSMTSFDRGMCDTCLWAQKYAPNSAEEVLQTGKEAQMLRDWLRFLIISAVDTGKPSTGEKAKQKAEDKKRAKKRKKADKLDGFVVSSEDEASEMDELSESDDELAGSVTVPSKRTVIRSGDLATSSKPGAERGRMTNAILLSGPPGCGKTASVYAVAKELDFEVFEINAGSRRSGRDIIERVGDMTRNHLVHKLNVGEGSSIQSSDHKEDGKQNKLMSFFKSKPTNTTDINAKKDTKPARKETGQEGDPRSSRPQKQSLILLEEADVLFEEDRQFWSGVMILIQQSRRPIIITCNDENLIPSQDLSFHAILRYRPPPHELAVDYMLLVAANEGHMLQRDAVNDLYTTTGYDLRRAMIELDFWCQMGIGSKKSGLDWMLDRWPAGADLDQNGDPLRVISLNTYEHYMGWFSRDMLLDDTMESDIETQQETLHWWRLSIQDSENMAFSGSRSGPGSPLPESKPQQLEKLRRESEYADMRSALDIVCAGCPVEPMMVSFLPLILEYGAVDNLCRMLLILLFRQFLRDTRRITLKAINYSKLTSSQNIHRWP